MSEKVTVYVTRPASEKPEGFELLVDGDDRRVPETSIAPGEHPCAAADRLVGDLLAPATGGVNVAFAYRKVRGRPGEHVFVTSPEAPLPDTIGTLRWVPVGDAAAWLSDLRK